MIEHAGISEQGPVRSNNEDFIAQGCPEDAAIRAAKGHLFVVADGVGGSLSGEVASREAAETLLRLYYESSRGVHKALLDAFMGANLRVYDLSQSVPEYRQMQTTLSAIALEGKRAVVGHIGDTRIYLVRGRAIQPLTKDHSEVGELLRMQIITPEEARTHHRRHIINRTIGSSPFLQADFRHVEVEIGDVFVLCTDGLWEPVSEREIAETVTDYPPDAACRRLVDLAIARETADNLSIQVVKVVEWERNETGAAPRKRNLWRRALEIFSGKRGGEERGDTDAQGLK